jgi:hypothetical protein
MTIVRTRRVIDDDGATAVLAAAEQEANAHGHRAWWCPAEPDAAGPGVTRSASRHRTTASAVSDFRQPANTRQRREIAAMDQVGPLMGGFS